jgi:hypothetical protein
MYVAVYVCMPTAVFAMMILFADRYSRSSVTTLKMVFHRLLQVFELVYIQVAEVHTRYALLASLSTL